MSEAKEGQEGMKDPYVPPEIIPKSRQRSRRTHTSHQIAAMTEEGKMFSLCFTHVSTATSENFLTYDTIFFILAYAICLVVSLSDCLSDCVRTLARTPSTSSFTYFPLLLLYTLNLLLLSHLQPPLAHTRPLVAPFSRLNAIFPLLFLDREESDRRLEAAET